MTTPTPTRTLRDAILAPVSDEVRAYWAARWDELRRAEGKCTHRVSSWDSYQCVTTDDGRKVHGRVAAYLGGHTYRVRPFINGGRYGYTLDPDAEPVVGVSVFVGSAPCYNPAHHGPVCRSLSLPASHLERRRSTSSHRPGAPCFLA